MSIFLYAVIRNKFSQKRTDKMSQPKLSRQGDFSIHHDLYLLLLLLLPLPLVMILLLPIHLPIIWRVPEPGPGPPRLPPEVIIYVLMACLDLGP